MLNIEQFTEAMQIISAHHSSTIKVNAPNNGFVGNMGKDFYRLHIKECIPSVVSHLIASGFMLSMTADGLLVEKV